MTGLLLYLVLSAPVAAEPPPEAVRAIRHLLVAWRDAWERQDLDLYLRCYADDFQNERGDKNWLRSHKQRVFARTNEATVVMRDVKLELADDGLIAVRFIQVYDSDQYQDTGLKTLLFAKRGERWLIVDERFEELPP
jgi:ketosteroid isomerase-like protein